MQKWNPIGELLGLQKLMLWQPQKPPAQFLSLTDPGLFIPELAHLGNFV